MPEDADKIKAIELRIDSINANTPRDRSNLKTRNTLTGNYASLPAF